MAFIVGSRVKARYMASELGAARTKWFPGVVKAEETDEELQGTGVRRYVIAYDDGEVESDVHPRYVKACSLPLPDRRRREANGIQYTIQGGAEI